MNPSATASNVGAASSTAASSSGKATSTFFPLCKTPLIWLEAQSLLKIRQQRKVFCNTMIIFVLTWRIVKFLSKFLSEIQKFLSTGGDVFPCLYESALWKSNQTEMDHCGITYPNTQHPLEEGQPVPSRFSQNGGSSPGSGVSTRKTTTSLHTTSSGSTWMESQRGWYKNTMQNTSAVEWRKVLLLLKVIFEIWPA